MRIHGWTNTNVFMAREYSKLAVLEDTEWLELVEVFKVSKLEFS